MAVCPLRTLHELLWIETWTCTVRWRCRFKVSLPAGRPGDRIPLKTCLSVLSRLAPKPKTVSYTMGSRTLSRVKQRKCGANHPQFVEPGCDWVGDIPLPPLCDCICMSWGDFYLNSTVRFRRTTGSAMTRPNSFFLNTVGLHLSGLIGTASH